MIDGYFQELQNLIASVPFISAVNLHTERRTETIGFVRGDLTFDDGSHLHFREFVRQQENEPAERYTYVYHYQSSVGELIFRYDNTNHYPDLVNAPHHKHIDAGTVTPAEATDLNTVLSEIGNSFSNSFSNSFK